MKASTSTVSGRAPEAAQADRIDAARWNYRRTLWLLVSGVYATGCVLLHEQVNQLAIRIIGFIGVPAYLWSTRSFALLGIGAVLFSLRRSFYINSARLKTLLIAFPIALVLDLALIVYPSERIHYPEYALLTLIAYKAVRQPLAAALLSYLAGFVDESHQFWVFYAANSNAYFDWNDIILNLMGAVAALFLFLPGEQSSGGVRKSRIAAAIALWILLAGLIIFFADPDSYLMRKQDTSSYWITSGLQTTYHVVNAMEGTILLGVILIVTIAYYWPGRVASEE